jgi:hypothetical protein
MLHKKRRWCVDRAASAEELAGKLTSSAWCLCTGFELDGYWFLNDAISEDSAQEYAIVKLRGAGGKPVQVESITMSWCTYEEALRYIKQAIAGEFDHSAFASAVSPHVESVEQHGRCPLCA